MAFLFLVLLHAVPVFALCAWTRSYAALAVAGLTSALLALTSGNPDYLVPALIGAAAAYIGGLVFISNRQQVLPQLLATPAPAPKIKRTGQDGIWVAGVVVVLTIGVSPNQIPYDVEPVVEPVVATVKKPSRKRPQARPMLAGGTAMASRAGTDLRHCLALGSNAAIVQCASRAH